LHATFYVQRPLAGRIAAGYTLTQGDIAELRSLLIRRDRWIELYQNMELEMNREIAETGAAVARLRTQIRVPLTGYVLQEGATEGLYGDGWAASRVRIGVKPLRAIAEIVLRGFRPEWAPPASVKLLAEGRELRHAPIKGDFEVGAVLARPFNDPFQIQIVCDSPPGWGASRGDNRDLAFILNELRAEHQ
jgi:hypothetical protein